MKHIKPILTIISFSLVLCVLLYMLTYLAKPVTDNLERNEGFYSEKADSMDMVYIGGSASFVYYMPLTAWEKYGIVSYDYGSHTMQPELYKTMITEILKTQSPKLIIVDARAFQYRDKENIDSQPPGEVPYRNMLTGMHLSKNKIDFINENVGTRIDDQKTSYYFDLIKYHSHVFDFERKNIEMMFGQYKDKYNGFHFVQKYAKIEQYDYRTDEKKPVSKDTEEILYDLLDYMDSTGIDYLFVVSPYAEKKEHKMTFNYVEEIIESRGYEFLDCNEHTEEMNLDYSLDLYNDNHVNVYGAEKFTDYISEYIMEKYSVPNRKDDEYYSFMNTYLPEWHDAVNETKTVIDGLIEGKPNE